MLGCMFLSGVDTLAKAKPKVAMIEDDDAEPAAALCDGGLSIT
jgi:hypothetical protein